MPAAPGPSYRAAPSKDVDRGDCAAWAWAAWAAWAAYPEWAACAVSHALEALEAWRAPSKQLGGGAQSESKPASGAKPESKPDGAKPGCGA